MTCKDCVHFEVCKDYIETALDGLEYGKINFVSDDCEFFKDCSRFMKLPADDEFRTVRAIDDLGRVMIPKRIRREQDIDYGDKILFTPIGKSQILLSKFKGSQEAEQALKEREKNA